MVVGAGQPTYLLPSSDSRASKGRSPPTPEETLGAGLPEVSWGCWPGALVTAVLCSQEILFYKVIDYILHGKEDIKVIP